MRSAPKRFSRDRLAASVLELRRRGKGYEEIARGLNRLGAATLSGQPEWTVAEVQGLLPPLVGGDDDDIDIPAKRDAMVDRKARKLADKVSKLFPHVPVQPAFAWAGTFAETADGLPWIGMSPEHGRRLLFAMAYGGNGITYSMLGAGLIRALVERRKHALQDLFGFQRQG